MVNSILLSSSWNSFIQLVGVLLIFLFVLVITYVVTRWLAGYQKGQMTGRNIEVIETARIANNKLIQIVRTGEVYLVIAIGKDEVNVLTQLTAEQLSDLPADNRESGLKSETFQEILSKVKQRFPKKKD